MTKYILLFSAFVALFGASAQDVAINPQVLSSGGSYFENADFSISQTISEMTAVTTLSAGDFTLTQGFQQDELKSTVRISDLEKFDAMLELFPNPAVEKTQLRFEFPTSGNLEMTIYNTLGQQVSPRFTENYSSGEQTFTFHTQLLAAGVYYINTVFSAQNGKQYLYNKKLEVIK